MTDKPRTWTLSNPFGTGVVVDGPEISLSEEVKVTDELEPVLDLLEPLLDGCTQVSDYFREKYDLAPAVAQAEALLREHGRLK